MPCIAIFVIGYFQHSFGDTCPMVSPLTARQAIDRTVKAINRVLGHRIQFPDPKRSTHLDGHKARVFQSGRSYIEQTFGIAKRRFALMKTDTRVCSMRKAASEILVCCVLYNYGIDEGDLMPEEDANAMDNQDSNLQLDKRGQGTDTALGQAVWDRMAVSIHRQRHHRQLHIDA
ncbi:uncharacterized protein LOC110978138 [Acanthaster planci]|uniref:Uncharacterized protein LOC110978138 n=1 Tax=Acanthaster planci TaxID=133434 RepID=A0A8B7Y8A3_ACAPL|nr:uncharacterized protein LOC110978138 [Acanthaster planci]